MNKKKVHRALRHTLLFVHSWRAITRIAPTKRDLCRLIPYGEQNAFLPYN